MAPVLKTDIPKGIAGSNPAPSANYGHMVEWSIALAWKARERKRSGGSNPPVSAI